MKVIISHYQNEIFRLREEIQFMQKDLHTITTTSPYDFLLKTLQSFVRKTRNKYTFIKTKKLNRLIKSQSHTSARKSGQSTQTLWIPEFSLTSDDRQSILDGDYISDRVIDAAMALLHKQRPFYMFQSVCFNYQFLHYFPWESIHICHDGRDHFVTTTTVGGNVKIFDSLNLSPSSDLMKQIHVLYSPDITIMPTVLKVELRSIQLGLKDCGLFAIAYAAEIVYDNDPAKFILKQSDMPQHLHNCLTSKSMSVSISKSTKTTHRFSLQRYHLWLPIKANQTSN